MLNLIYPTTYHSIQLEMPLYTRIAREVKMIGYSDDLDELIYSNIQPINLELTQTILTTK